MPGNGEIFLDQMHAVRGLDIGVLATPQYFEPQMRNHDANSVGWHEFREGIRPAGVVGLNGSELECLVVPKSIPWGSEDLTIFVGAVGRTVNEIDDLSDEEGKEFLGCNFSIAEDLTRRGYGDLVNISIGFNPQDLSVGHHTVLRLHSHIRTINDHDRSKR